MEITENTLRKVIRNMIMEKASRIKESDLLFKKKSDWNSAKKSLKSDLVDLLKNIESDDYIEGVGKIKDVISSLNDWKKKLEKNLIDEAS